MDQMVLFAFVFAVSSSWLIDLISTTLHCICFSVQIDLFVNNKTSTLK
uniref:Uncharacterized protein n=1 Tax=Anguilla anguilla TaxID=7936 RepID=A0A0E9QUM3_ANGAN